MNIRAVILLIWGLFATSLAKCPTSEWTPAEGNPQKCFLLQVGNNAAKKLDDAREDCKKRGGTLASIENQPEQNTVTKMIKDRDIDGYIYIGGKRKGNSWGWEDRNLDITYKPTLKNYISESKYVVLGINTIPVENPPSGGYPWQGGTSGEDKNGYLCSFVPEGYGKETGTGTGTGGGGVDEDSQCDPKESTGGGGDNNNGNCGCGGCGGGCGGCGGCNRCCCRRKCC